MIRAAPLLCLALAACAGPPRRLVIQDDPVLVDLVLESLATLEDLAGCRFYKRLDVGGTARDWRGRWAPRGTVTIGVDPSRVPGGAGGYSAYPLHRVIRGRIHLPSNRVRPVVVEHELGHMLGLKHSTDEPGYLMSGRGRVTQTLFPGTLEKLRSRCLPGSEWKE